MHSSALDTPPSPSVHHGADRHSPSPPSSLHSPGGQLSRDGGELLVAVATLVTEGRIPIQTPARKGCNVPPQQQQQQQQCSLSNGSNNVGKGKGCGAQVRGFYEGPHCHASFCSLGGGGSKGGGFGGSPQRALDGQGEKHCCNPADDLCQKYEQVRSEVLNLWQKGIPLCVEVFLKNTCPCEVLLEGAGSGSGSLLLERWYLSVSHFRSPDISSSSSSTNSSTSSSCSSFSPPTTFHNFSQLINAIRSQLYFSQISAWLSPTPNPVHNSPLSFHYRLAIPGETFDTPTFGQRPPHIHTFPSTDLGNGLLLNIQLESLPRVEGGRVPTVQCGKCCAEETEGGGDGEVLGGRRSVSPRGENKKCEVKKQVGGLFDDRMHTRCTLKGKHRCDDLDDFDSTLASHTEQQVLGGKYKRLCHNDTSTQRSPQRAAFPAHPHRRLSTTSSCCDCQQQQLPSTSASSYSNNNTSSSSSSKKSDGSYEGVPGCSGEDVASPANVNKGIRFCYQSFGDVFGGPSSVDGLVVEEGCAGGDGVGSNKGGVEELNQNEKRNSVQPHVEEPHKTPKLDLGDRKAPPLEMNIGDDLSVIPSDLNKHLQQPNKAPERAKDTNSGSSVDFLLPMPRQSYHRLNDDKVLLKETNNNSSSSNNGKCDVKCVQRLGRIGTSILHGCSRVLQTVSDTSTTTNSDIYNLSQNSKVNKTVYVNEQQQQQTPMKPWCKMRDITNNTNIRRKITFDDQTKLKPTADSPISPPAPPPRQPTNRQLFKNVNFPSSSSSSNIIICHHQKSSSPSFDILDLPSSSSSGSNDSSSPSSTTTAVIAATNQCMCSNVVLPSNSNKGGVCDNDEKKSSLFDGSVGLAATNIVEIPSPLDKAQFRRSLDNAASMVFHARTGLPLTSSPAPVRRGNTTNTCFGFDESIDSVSAIKSALFSGSLSTDDDSESDGSIVSPCSPDAFLTQQPSPTSPSSYYSHATLLTNSQHHNHHHHHHQHAKHSNNNNSSVTAVQQHHCNKRRGTSSSHLLGTFEESALNGRLEPAATVHGFKAELGASGSFVPPHRIVPVTVFFYTFGDSDKVSSPYLGHINLGKKGYNVPRTGTVQVTLFNPLGTVVKMFVIMYDLADMPNNSQTFIRQRTLYMPTNCKDTNLEWGPKWLRYLIHLRFMSSKSGKIYLHSDIRMIIFRKCDLDTATAHGIDMCYELRSFTHMPHNPKYSPRK